MGTRLSGNELRAELLVPFATRRGSVLVTVERVVIRLNQTVFVVGRDNSGTQRIAWVRSDHVVTVRPAMSTAAAMWVSCWVSTPLAMSICSRPSSHA